MPAQQQLRVFCQLASLLIIITTATDAANWQVTIADPEPAPSDDGGSVLSAEDPKDPPSEKQDLAKSGTAWVRTYNKPPGADAATIYDSDVSRSDAWDPVKDFQVSDPARKGLNLFSVAKKPSGSIRYGTKTSVAAPLAASNVEQGKYPQINTINTSYSTPVTSEERKDKNRKDVIWTAAPINRYTDWSLKNTAAQDGWHVDDNYSPLSIPNSTVWINPMSQRREADDTSGHEYDNHAEVSIEEVNVDPKDWQVVDEDGVDGWKVLDKEGNVEWEIKLENGSWVVMDRGGEFSHKVDNSNTLNGSSQSSYNYENEYLTDYGNYYEEANYEVPGGGEIYLVSNFDDTWPKVTNIAIPEPWHGEDYQTSHKVSDFWPQKATSKIDLDNKDETTTTITTTTTSTTTTTQAPVTTVKQSPMETESIMVEMTDKPQVTTKLPIEINRGNTTGIGSIYLNQNKYYGNYKGTPFNKYPTNLVKWAQTDEDSTSRSNDKFPKTYNTSKSNYNNGASRTSSSKQIIQNQGQNPEKTPSQWITGYGSQTWKAGSGKNEWDSINSTTDVSANKASAWGNGYGTKVWNGNEWNSNVVWKTEYGPGLWNIDNGTSTFTFPSNIYGGGEKTHGKGNYKEKHFKPKISFPQFKKNYTNAHQNVFVLYEDKSSDNFDNQDLSDSKQEEWADEKSVGGVVWQEDTKPFVDETKWKYPENTDASSQNGKTSRDKKYNPKTWNSKWSGAPFIVAGPGWKPSTMLSEKNGWKPSGADDDNWKITNNVNKIDSPVDGSTIEEPGKQLKPPRKNVNMTHRNKKIYRPNNPQFWNVNPGSYKAGEWETPHGHNLPIPGWKTGGKSWKPPTFVWQEDYSEASTTTVAPTADSENLPPTVIYSVKPNPIYIKWRKTTPSSFKWPVATPISIKWTKPPVKKWRKSTTSVPTTSVPTTETPMTTTTTTTPITTEIPSRITPKISYKFPPIKYVWPIKTFNPKSWEPLQPINPPDCKDKPTTVPTTVPTTMPTTTTTMAETTTTMPIMTTEKSKDHIDTPNFGHPPIIIIKKIPPGFKNIKFANKGKGRPKFRPPPPQNFYEWGNYKGKPLQISSSQGKGYYKGTPFRVIPPTKFRKQKRKTQIPKWVKSSYKGSSGNVIPIPQWWPSPMPNYAKWIPSNQKPAPSSYTTPKATWKDALKKIFG